MSEATTVLRVGEMDLSLVSQCMEFYKHLTNKGPAFKFSFSLSTVFNFSMDFSQADKLTPSGKPNRKKQSPGTLKINAYRSQIFLEKKAKENQVRNCLVEGLTHSSEVSVISMELCMNPMKPWLATFRNSY